MRCLRFKKPNPIISNYQSFSNFHCFFREKPSNVVDFKLYDGSILKVTGMTIQWKSASFNRMTDNFKLLNHVYWTLLNTSS